jgi:hypothetical protein
MKHFVATLLAGLLLSATPAFACSPPELLQKQKAFGDAVKAAFAHDPAGDPARQARVQAITARYGELMHTLNGGAIIDALCRENDELLAIYK